MSPLVQPIGIAIQRSRRSFPLRALIRPTYTVSYDPTASNTLSGLQYPKLLKKLQLSCLTSKQPGLTKATILKEKGTIKRR